MVSPPRMSVTRSRSVKSSIRLFEIVGARCRDGLRCLALLGCLGNAAQEGIVAWRAGFVVFHHVSIADDSSKPATAQTPHSGRGSVRVVGTVEERGAVALWGWRVRQESKGFTRGSDMRWRFSLSCEGWACHAALCAVVILPDFPRSGGWLGMRPDLRPVNAGGWWTI